MIKHQLQNGLRVIYEKIPTYRSVAFGIWVKTGSRTEYKENNGISHLIEHMLFKGTDKYTAKTIAEQFDGIGGHVNAFTSKEYTCYYVKVLDQHFHIAIDILSDMFFHSKLNEEDILKEKNVIYEEIAMYEDTPDDLVHDLISTAAYGNHSLGYPILGTELNLSALSSHDLREYMDQHYHIDNTVISIAGNINDQMIQLVEHHFGNFTNRKLEQSLNTPEYNNDLIFSPKATEQNHLCIAYPGCSLSDDHIYAMALLTNTIGGGMSSRLFQQIREDRGLAYSIYSYHTAYADHGLFTIYAGTAPKQTDEVLKVTSDVIQNIAHNQLTASELAKGKEQLKGSLILSLESSSSRMNRLGKNELMLGRHRSLDQIIEKIDAVQMSDIKALSDRVFTQPFAFAMVGKSDKVASKLRGGHYAL